MTATSSVSLTFCSPWGGRWRRCPTGKPIWFLHPPAERADAAAARRLGILYGATRALALEQPAWWGGVVELDPADGRGLHRFARLLVGVPRHDHLKIRGTRVFARYLEVRPAASRRIGSASAGAARFCCMSAPVPT